MSIPLHTNPKGLKASICRKISRVIVPSQLHTLDKPMDINPQHYPSWYSNEKGEKNLPLIIKLLRKVFYQKIENDSNKALVSIKESVICVPNGAQLDTITFIHSYQAQLPINQQKYIVTCNGNTLVYELRLMELWQESLDFKVNIIGFNYRGVARSKGIIITASNLIEDGVYQIQELLNKGILPENILMTGTSLGGAVSALVANYFLQKKLCINILNDRSFSSVPKTAAERIRITLEKGKKPPSSPSPKIGQLLAAIYYPIIRFVTRSFDWEMSTVDAYNQHPSHQKEMFTITYNKFFKGTSNPMRIHLSEDFRGDLTIHYCASLDFALSEQQRLCRTMLNEALGLSFSLQKDLQTPNTDTKTQLIWLGVKLRMALTGAGYFLYHEIKLLADKCLTIKNEFDALLAAPQELKQKQEDYLQQLKNINQKIAEILEKKLTQHRMTLTENNNPAIDPHTISLDRLCSETDSTFTAKKFYNVFVRRVLNLE